MRKHPRPTAPKPLRKAASSYALDYRRGLILRRVALALAEPLPETMRHWARA
jgi:hypothetical protein